MKQLLAYIDSLKFDPKKVQTNEPGSWPILLKIAAWLVIIAVVVWGGDNYYLSDKKAELQAKVSEEATLRADFEDKAFQAKNLPQLREQMEEATRTLGALLKQLPSQTEVPGLLEDITKTGIGSGLEFKEITIQPERKVQFYVELPIKITATGGYHDLATFVSGISSLSRIVTLHDFSLTPIPGKDGSLSMQISAITYRADSVDIGIATDTSSATNAQNDNGAKQ